MYVIKMGSHIQINNTVKIFINFLSLFIIVACSSTKQPVITHENTSSYKVTQTPTVELQSHTASPLASSTQKPVFYQKGIASYYGASFIGKKTTSGERYNPKSFTAASRTLPMNTLAMVESIRTGQCVIVRINDRGPYAKHRIIDLSTAAAKKIGLYKHGIAKVNIYLLQ